MHFTRSLCFFSLVVSFSAFAQMNWETIPLSDPNLKSINPSFAFGSNTDGLAVWLEQQSDGSLKPKGKQFSLSERGEPQWSESFYLPAKAMETSQSLSVGMNSRGDMVAAWMAGADQNKTHKTIQVMTKLETGKWVNTVISDPEIDARSFDLQVAIGPSGDAVATWVSPTKYARLVRAATFNQNSWSQPITVATLGKGTTKPYAVVDDMGNGVAVWYAHNFGDKQSTMQAATLRNRTWSIPVTISDPNRLVGQFLVTSHPFGQAVIAWTESDQGQNTEIKTIVKNSSGWSTTQTVAATEAAVALISLSASATDGTTAIVWDDGKIRKSTMETDGTWGPATVVSVSLGAPSEGKQLEINHEGDGSFLMLTSTPDDADVLTGATLKPDGTWNLSQSVYQGEVNDMSKMQMNENGDVMVLIETEKKGCNACVDAVQAVFGKYTPPAKAMPLTTPPAGDAAPLTGQ